MTFQLVEPILLIGLGGVGARLAEKAKKSLNSDCLLISHDQKDLTSENSIKISTKSVVNPSTHLIRGSTLEVSDDIKKNMGKYSTVILMSNLAGKAGAGIGPIVSKICKQEQKNLLSFAIMPFKFEKERIFQSGISLKRIRQDSQCTIVVDNDALLDSNPDLTQNQCFDISNNSLGRAGLLAIDLVTVAHTIGLITAHPAVLFVGPPIALKPEFFVPLGTMHRWPSLNIEIGGAGVCLPRNPTGAPAHKPLSSTGAIIRASTVLHPFLLPPASRLSVSINQMWVPGSACPCTHVGESLLMDGSRPGGSCCIPYA